MDRPSSSAGERRVQLPWTAGAAFLVGFAAQRLLHAVRNRKPWASDGTEYKFTFRHLVVVGLPAGAVTCELRFEAEAVRVVEHKAAVQHGVAAWPAGNATARLTLPRCGACDRSQPKIVAFDVLCCDANGAIVATARGSLDLSALVVKQHATTQVSGASVPCFANCKDGKARRNHGCPDTVLHVQVEVQQLGVTHSTPPSTAQTVSDSACTAQHGGSPACTAQHESMAARPFLSLDSARMERSKAQLDSSTICGTAACGTAAVDTCVRRLSVDDSATSLVGLDTTACAQGACCASTAACFGTAPCDAGQHALEAEHAWQQHATAYDTSFDDFDDDVILPQPPRHGGCQDDSAWRPCGGDGDDESAALRRSLSMPATCRSQHAAADMAGMMAGYGGDVACVESQLQAARMQLIALELQLSHAIEREECARRAKNELELALTEQGEKLMSLKRLIQRRTHATAAATTTAALAPCVASF